MKGMVYLCLFQQINHAETAVCMQCIIEGKGLNMTDYTLSLASLEAPVAKPSQILRQTKLYCTGLTLLICEIWTSLTHFLPSNWNGWKYSATHIYIDSNNSLFSSRQRYSEKALPFSIHLMFKYENQTVQCTLRAFFTLLRKAFAFGHEIYFFLQVNN